MLIFAVFYSLLLHLPANISYFFRAKKNYLLPNIFNDYILDMSVTYYGCEDVENYRNQLLKCETIINIADFGAGSHKLGKTERKIKNIAYVSGTRPEFGVFYQKLISSFGVKDILEMGTSLGIGTYYLSQASSEINLTGIEACPETAAFHRKKLIEYNIRNVKIINDTFDLVFDNNLLAGQKFDLVFIDGNHRGKYLLKYYQILTQQYCKKPFIIIADDINWSSDMYKAWKNIVNSGQNTYLDLYRCGVVMSGYDLPAGLFTLNFVNNQSI